jgi:hypothetical protein
MSELKSSISLRRFNGIGGHMGKVTPVLFMGGRPIGISCHYFTFLFLPLIPLGWYIVDDWGGSYRFHGKINSSVCNEVFGEDFVTNFHIKEIGRGLLVLAALIAFIAVLNGVIH